jgi:hypothetical protein
MARSLPIEEATNSDVRFERSDIEYAGVVWFAIVLAVSLAIVIPSCIWLSHLLLNNEKKQKATILPEAQVDKTRAVPQPVLEALEDLALKKKIQLFPPRAAEAYAADKEKLAEGMPKTLADLKLKHRASGDTAPPTQFSTRLPSKGAAGRIDTGGN